MEQWQTSNIKNSIHRMYILKREFGDAMELDVIAHRWCFCSQLTQRMYN